MDQKGVALQALEKAIRIEKDSHELYKKGSPKPMLPRERRSMGIWPISGRNRQQHDLQG